MKIFVYILISFISFTLCLSGYKTFLSLTHPIKYEKIIISNCELFDLDEDVVASLINVESGYKKDAKSNKNAIGLMQIKLETANYLNDIENKSHITEEDLFIPEINIEYGCKYLRYLINKFEDINTSLAAYNAGETRVRSWLKSDTYTTDGKTLKTIPYKETEKYIEKINKNIEYYKKIY